MPTFEINTLSLGLFLLLFTIPLIIFQYLQIRMSKTMLWSALRMIIQLFLVALYLEYIFALDSPLISCLWVLVMIIITNLTVLKRSGLPAKTFALPVFGAFALTTLVITASFLVVFDIRVLFSARYLIPLEGMVLGNILRANIVGLERFYARLKSGQDEYIQYITLGATRQEALRPFLQEAYQAAIAPQMATMATMGLISLPGMMTGQILGGNPPGLAIKYQIMILTAIFNAASLSVILAINFSAMRVFDRFDRFLEK